MRRRIFDRWLKLTRHQEGTFLLWYHHIVHWILFPLTSFYWFAETKASIWYDVITDTLHFHGKKYSGKLLAMGLKPGTYQITIKKDHEDYYTLTEVK